jgi:hypothetical protein
MPTKRRRHAITETPAVADALDAVRAELNGARLDLPELVILGAEEKLSRLRAGSGDRRARLRALADDLRAGNIHLDPALADAAKQASLPEEPSPS